MKKERQEHGYTHHPLYSRYYHMRSRCENKADCGYERYGGRGIKVCDEWRNDIVAFIEWGIANGFKEGLSLDRIDNNGDYSPENCRWADATQQCNNRRTNAFLTLNGEKHTYAEWGRITGINQFTIRTRIEDLGWSVEDALTTPTDERRYGILQDANIKVATYKNGKLVGVFNSMSEASKHFGYERSRVSQCIQKGSVTRKGYTFKRYEEIANETD